MTSSIGQWNVAFAIISLIVAIFGYIIPLPSYEHKITRHFWAWIFVRFVTFMSMWYVLYALGTILAFSLGIVHEGHDEVHIVEMYSSIVFAVVALLFTFCGEVGWAFVVAALISTMISKFLPLDQIVHQAVFPLLAVAIGAALCYLMRSVVATFIARIQTSLVISGCIVLSAMVLQSGSRLILSTDTNNSVILLMAVLIGTAVKLMIDWIYATAMECCGYETLVSAPKPEKTEKEKKKEEEKEKRKKKKEKRNKPIKTSSSSDDESGGAGSDSNSDGEA